MKKTHPKWPAYTVVSKPLDWFKPFENNPKDHPKAQIAILRRLMDEFGWTIPILADEDGEVIAGHGRLLAAWANEYDEAPTIIARGWTDAQKRAYRIADNKLAEMATWKMDLLKDEFGELVEAGYDLDLTGFSAGELEDMGVGQDLGDEEDDELAPEPPKKPVVRAGDLWLLGKHRLLCGDATKAQDVARLLGDAKPPLTVTDPPYGVNYDPNWRNERKRPDGETYRGKSLGKVKNDDKSDWREAWALVRGPVIYVWHGDLQSPVVFESLVASKFRPRSQIIWAKDRFVISRASYHFQHEACWYAVREGDAAHWTGDRKQTTLWEIPSPRNESGHSAQKPVECMRRPMLNHTKPGDPVYDPFVGSGTTIIAAAMERRICLAIEIDPGYVQVAIERWQEFTGETATREDGKTLAALKKSTK